MSELIKKHIMKNQNQISRRNFIQLTGIAIAGTSLAGCGMFGKQNKLKIYESRAMGCFMGAAIADAMGGPVECQHYKRIAKFFPDFRDHIPYNRPPATLLKLHPGYALDEAPGNVTDDTYIRMDLARFVLETDPPYTASSFAPWLIKHANLKNWWIQAVRALERVADGSVSPEEGGMHHMQGGGGAWWQPLSILHAADPDKASAVTADMCRIWKAPLEQDILSSVVAGQAAAYKKGATIDSVVNAILDDSGPLARKLFSRAVEIAKKAKNTKDLYEQIYNNLLVKSCSTKVDGPMPERLEPIDKLDGIYTGILFAEQQPLALAYFVYGEGDPYKTVLTAVKGGRDSDSIASNTAAWLGALHGISVWPKKWVDTVQQANISRMNLLETGQKLIEKGLGNNTVKLDLM